MTTYAPATEEQPPQFLIDHIDDGARPGRRVRPGDVARWVRFRPDPAVAVVVVACPICSRRDRRIGPIPDGPDWPGIARSTRHRLVHCDRGELALPSRPDDPDHFRVPFHVGHCDGCRAGFWALNWGTPIGGEPGDDDAVRRDAFLEAWPGRREPRQLAGLDPRQPTGLAECPACPSWRPGDPLLPVPLRRAELGRGGLREPLAVLMGDCPRCGLGFWG